MTYNEYIQNIINTRGQWNIPEGEYNEKHHIIPKCMGGEGDYKNGGFKRKSNHPNCIWLYPKEHFIAHKLLAEENQDNIPLNKAFNCMAFPKGKTKRNFELSADEYEAARIAAHKASFGPNNPAYGKHPWNYGLTKETNDIVLQYSLHISQTKTGVKIGPNSEEAKNNKKLAAIKRVKEHPETFIGRGKAKHWICITNGTDDTHYINPEEDIPEGYRRGMIHKPHDMSNYYSNKDMQAKHKYNSSGARNGMYGNGYKISGGKNGSATIRYFYKDEVFECRKDLINYLESKNIQITSSAIRIFINKNGTKRLYSKYPEVFNYLTWEYKDEN